MRASRQVALLVIRLGHFTAAAGVWAGLDSVGVPMPAPHRRNKGESLAQKVSAAGRVEALPDRRDRQAAHRTRHAGRWEDAAASLVVEQPVDVSPPSISRQAKEKGREALLIRAAASASRRALRVTIDQPCPTHGAPAGQACWDLPGRVSACGARIRSAGLTRSASDRSTGVKR